MNRHKHHALVEITTARQVAHGAIRVEIAYGLAHIEPSEELACAPRGCGLTGRRAESCVPASLGTHSLGCVDFDLHLPRRYAPTSGINSQVTSTCQMEMSRQTAVFPSCCLGCTAALTPISRVAWTVGTRSQYCHHCHHVHGRKEAHCLYAAADHGLKGRPTMLSNWTV
ncbi:hypothetical protein J1614_002944 [Plenodomus biglobosus]|nr:hypothetical protein J1614_002944 [Plenodomus biglobosus]